MQSSSSDFNLQTLMPDLASPLTKDLFWRHCDFKNLFSHHWSIVKCDHDSSKMIKSEMDLNNSIVFVNGQYSDTLSNHSDNIKVIQVNHSNDLDKTLVKNYFRIMNSQLESSNYQMTFSKSVPSKTMKILHFMDAGQPILIPLNIKMIFQSGFAGSLEFHYISNCENPAWINQCIDFELESHAQLAVYEFYDQSKGLNITHTSKISLGEKSQFKQFIAHKHFDFMYYQQDVYLNDFMAQWQCNGFTILKEMQKSHHRFKVYHKAKKSVSKQFMRSLLSDESWSLWDSSVVVANDAKGSDSLQMNNNLLLGEKSKVLSIPILEIDEDDVSCSHGSTVGALDEMMLFYLQSRGLSIKESLSLMKRAFIAEVIQNFDDNQNLIPLKKYLISNSLG